MSNKSSPIRMAEAYSVSATGEPGFVWKWRTVDGAVNSKQSFVYYYDCVKDARANGYQIELAKSNSNVAAPHNPQAPLR